MKHKLLLPLIGMSTCLLLFASLRFAEASPQAALDKRYQHAVVSTLAASVREADQLDSLPQLLENIRQAISDQRPATALRWVSANRSLIVREIDHPNLAALLQDLLDLYAMPLAEDILAVAETDASDYALAKLRLVLGRHHAARREWQQAIHILDQVDIENQLTLLEGDEAFISYGISLQGLKRHREAVRYYARVNRDSPHYAVAQLNTALAYIRQDWWTDAHIAIDSAIKSRQAADDMTDRLHTVLGFSQIQHGLYRKARESFRNVRVDSPYAQRALLGLGIAALNQEDTVGALNAFSHLKEQDQNDISTIESYLLSAYALERQGQVRTAAAAYGEAIAFYQGAVGRYENLIDKVEQTQGSLQGRLALMEAMGTALPSSQDLRAAAIMATILDELMQVQADDAIRSLHASIDEAFGQAMVAALSERMEILNSYLSQARFRLAQLYDTR